MHTDYILAIVGEEAGLIGTMSLLLVYALFSWRSYSLWTALDDPSMKSLLWGLILSLLLPLFINLAGVLKMAPLSGMPLPFLSYGGSSLLFMWMRVGIMLKISSQFKAKERVVDFHD
jgi:cell division protein FtsW